MVNAIKESFDEDDLAKFQELLSDAEKPLYKGCPDFTKLSAIIKLLNLKDSQAWRTIDEKFPKIAKDLRNLRLGISADGVDVNSRTRHHITGVDTYDASTKENFNLRVVVLWKINDYLAHELGIKPELFARQEEDKTTLPIAVYTLTNAKKTSFMKRYQTSGYHKAIVQISLVWKEIILQELDKLQLELVVTLCLLEKLFPLLFFDIMIHLTVHLTSEVERELAISKDSVSKTWKLLPLLVQVNAAGVKVIAASTKLLLLEEKLKLLRRLQLKICME
nr:hypothetical protein [Tanacetum cinerariifolium]